MCGRQTCASHVRLLLVVHGNVLSMLGFKMSAEIKINLLVGTLIESRDPNADCNREMPANKRFGPDLSDSRESDVAIGILGSPNRDPVDGRDCLLVLV